MLVSVLGGCCSLCLPPGGSNQRTLSALPSPSTGQPPGHILFSRPGLKTSTYTCLLYLCKIYRRSPVRKHGCRLRDAISVRLSARPSVCPSVPMLTTPPSPNPFSQVWITREPSPKSPIQSYEVGAKLKPLLPKPTTVSANLSFLISLFLFLSIRFDICSFSLPESDTEDTQGITRQKHL